MIDSVDVMEHLLYRSHCTRSHGGHRFKSDMDPAQKSAVGHQPPSREIRRHLLKVCHKVQGDQCCERRVNDVYEKFRGGG